MIRVTFECDGCDARASATLSRHFESFSGKGWGFGSYRHDTPQDVAPAGWITFDPYTSCTYCPSCWSGIERTADGDTHD